MIEQQTVTLEAALSAYQVLFGDPHSWLGRDVTSADIDQLRAEKRRLLCVLAGLPADEPDPLSYICAQERWHRQGWHIEAGQVMCPYCTTGSTKPIGFWSAGEVLESLPMWREMLRRATGQESERWTIR